MEILNKHGSIEVICGPMFSGKSTELIRRATRAKLAKLDVVVLKPSLDNRYHESKVVTHNGIEIDAIVVEDYDKPFFELPVRVKEADVIAVDEVQFFDPCLITQCELLANEGKTVILAGLDTDFRGESFFIMEKLLPKADFVTKLTAICAQCGALATKTQRLINGEPASYDDPIILIGEFDHYEARCRKCHEVRRNKLNIYVE